VAGEPATSVTTPTLAPSTVTVTVPLGYDVFTVAGVTSIVTGSEAPSAGAVVDGTTTVMVVVLATVKLATDETELKKFESPL
jgi:uncharacterized Zn-binding protein involved in type VI secretion